MMIAGSLKRSTYAGLFMITLATLMYEILLTRIFSVTMWYHFAFMAISIALFGMTVGALLVYLFPRYFAPERVNYHLALSALLFSVSIVLSFLTHLSIPYVPLASLVFVYSMVLTYAVISIPFAFSGICVSLALTRFPAHVSKLYGADLAGAAAGTLLLIYTLRVTDGPTTVVVVALFAAIGAVFFAAGDGDRLRRTAIVTSLVLASLAAIHTVLAMKQVPVLRVVWVKGKAELRPLYERWNSFSRVRVSGDPRRLEEPFGWGFGGAYTPERQVRQLLMDIDATALTVLTAFNGDLRGIGYLKYDVTNLVHYIRPGSRVLVIGPGGGRDILSAMVFGQRSVLAVEINDDIIRTVNRRFGDFTGHLDRDPRVTFVVDEARSYVLRQHEKFDIIQASLIDTFAATTAGAFALTENSLYTVEAWKAFLERLAPNGVLTFSRWYFQGTPAEVYRMTALATASLMELGVKDPRGHIVLVKNASDAGTGDAPLRVGTITISRP